MREHKYQAWQKHHKEMFEVAAISFVSAVSSGFVVKRATSGHNVETWTFDEIELREFTGLLDKHGKEIFEGDIVEYLDNTSRGLVKKIVVIKDIRHLPDFSCSKWEEVIGNIYETPDLIPKDE